MAPSARKESMNIICNTPATGGNLQAAIISVLCNSGFVVLEYEPTNPLAPFTVTGSLASAAIAIDQIVALCAGAQSAATTPVLSPSPQLWHECWAAGRLELAYKNTSLTIAYESYLDFCERHGYHATSCTKFLAMLRNKVTTRRMWHEKKLQTFIVAAPEAAATPQASMQALLLPDEIAPITHGASAG
jgi:hypothetical protein